MWYPTLCESSPLLRAVVVISKGPHITARSPEISISWRLQLISHDSSFRRKTQSSNQLCLHDKYFKLRFSQIARYRRESDKPKHDN